MKLSAVKRCSWDFIPIRYCFTISAILDFLFLATLIKKSENNRKKKSKIAEIVKQKKGIIPVLKDLLFKKTQPLRDRYQTVQQFTFFLFLSF